MRSDSGRKLSTPERLPAWRKKEDLSYELAAEVTEISQGILHKIETGQMRVTDRTAKKLAKAWGLKSWWNLVTETPTKTSEKRQVA